MIEKGVAALRQRRGARDARLLQDQAAKWLVDYYTNAGEGKHLYALPDARRIPYLTRPSWTGALDVDYATFRASVEVDKRAIERLKGNGYSVWDDEVLVLVGLVDAADVRRVTVGSAGYFQSVTVSERLRAEMAKSIRRGVETPVRDAGGKTLEHLMQGRFESQLCGFTIATALHIDGEPQFLVQQRSAANAIGAGRKAAVPAFVLNPNQVLGLNMPPAKAGFYIELLEELFDHEKATSSRKSPTSRWVLGTWPVSELEGSPSFFFEPLGFGFDAETCELNQAYLAYVSDESLSMKILDNMRASWEVSSIELIPAASGRMADAVGSRAMYHTSAFTFALARAWLMRRGARSQQ